jgi:cell division protein FtsB
MSAVVKRIVWVLVFAGALAFALQGGEYSTADLWRQYSHKRGLKKNVDSLQKLVDSLGRFSKLVQTDSATQERIAREEFGMVRGDKEILYRFGDPDSTKTK